MLRLTQQYELLLMALLAVIACLWLGWQSWELGMVIKGKTPYEKPQVMSQRKMQAAVPTLKEVSAWHLFGDPSAAKALSANDLPQTTLQLVLIGAMTNTIPAQASALISANNKVKRYFVNESVPGDAVLHQVLADSVILKRGERYETLKFPDPDQQKSTAQSALPSLTPAFGGGASAPKPPAATGAVPVAQPPRPATAGQPKTFSLRERYKPDIGQPEVVDPTQTTEQH